MFSSIVMSLCTEKEFARAVEFLASMKSKYDAVPTASLLALVLEYVRDNSNLAAMAFKSARSAGLIPSNSNWSTLVNIFAKSGKLTEAQAVIGDMIAAKKFPDDDTTGTVINGLLASRTLEECAALLRKLILAEVPLPAVVSTVFRKLASTGQCDTLMDLVRLHSKSPVRMSVVLYTTTIGDLGRQGQINHALEVYELMKVAGVTPNGHTYGALINHLCLNKRVEEALKFLPLVEKSHPGSATVSAFTTLLNHYMKDNNPDKALEVLERMIRHGSVPTELTLNLVAMGLHKLNRFDKIAEVMSRMIDIGVKLSVPSYNTYIDGLCKVNKVDFALTILEHMREAGHKPDAYTFTSLITGFGRIGRMDKAEEIFEDMLASKVIPVTATYTALLQGYATQNKPEHVETHLNNIKSIPEIRLTYYTLRAIAGGFVAAGASENALRFTNSLESYGVKPDADYYSEVIFGLCNEVKVKEALVVLDEVISKNLKPNPFMMSVVTDSLLKVGFAEDAVRAFDKMVAAGGEPNSLSYNALINVHCHLGNMGKAMEILHIMENSGSRARPTVSTYSTILSSYLKAKRVKEAVDLFASMNVLPRQDMIRSVIKVIMHKSESVIFINNFYWREPFA
jgi:pentatricopeptide repeat protein